MNNKKLLRRFYDKKFHQIREILAITDKPAQGWIKTMREILGITMAQLANQLKITQPRVANMEKNEQNLKISTLEKIADALNCKFVYMFIPNDRIEYILYEQAKKKALKILNKVNQNMSLENQLANTDEILEDLIQDLLANNLTRIWDEVK